MRSSSKALDSLHRQLGAVEEFYDAQSFQAGRETLHRQCGMLFFLQGDYEMAKRHLDVALDSHNRLHAHESLAETYFQRGLIAEQLREHDEAIDNYRYGSHCDPKMGNLAFISKCERKVQAITGTLR